MSKLFSKNHQQTTLEETQEEEIIINTSYYISLSLTHQHWMEKRTDVRGSIYSVPVHEGVNSF